MARTTRSTIPGRAIPRHTFRFHVDYQDGRGPIEVSFPCKVRYATKPVALLLLNQDYEKASELGGIGNSMMCAGAQCVKRSRGKFPHPVIGLIDFLKKTCFVATKVDKNNRPIECVKYEHYSPVPALFDKPGQKELKKLLADNDGKLSLNLLPARYRVGESSKGGNVPRTGARSTPTGLGSGAKRRYAEAMLQHAQIKAS